MELNIIPYEGVGPIRFGMTPDEVRRAVGKSFTTFMKGRTSEFPADHFSKEGIFVYYRLPGICEAVEMAPPADPAFHGTKFLGRPYAATMSRFLEIDSSAQSDSTGVTSYVYGFGLYTPDEDDPEAIVEGLIVFEKDYYSRNRALPAPSPTEVD